jgi:hypothetical protein
MPNQSTDFAISCKEARNIIKTAAAIVNELQHHPVFDPKSGRPLDQPEPNGREMHANITLAYRHLEDAAMRVGKAIQAYDGGTSVYDK